MKKQNQIWSLLLCVVMVLAILPTKAFAADAIGATEVGTKEELVAAVNASGSGDVILNNDILDITTQLTVERDVTLDLNGHHLKIDVIDGTKNGIK